MKIYVNGLFALGRLSNNIYYYLMVILLQLSQSLSAHRSVSADNDNAHPIHNLLRSFRIPRKSVVRPISSSDLRKPQACTRFLLKQKNITGSIS